MRKITLASSCLFLLAAACPSAADAPDDFMRAAVDFLMFENTPFGAADPTATYDLIVGEKGQIGVKLKGDPACGGEGLCTMHIFKPAGLCKVVYSQIVSGPTGQVVSERPPRGAGWLRPAGSTFGDKVLESTTAVLESTYDFTQVTGAVEGSSTGYRVRLEGARVCRRWKVLKAPSTLKAGFEKQAAAITAQSTCAEPFGSAVRRAGPGVDLLKSRAATIVAACRKR